MQFCQNDLHPTSMYGLTPENWRAYCALDPEWREQSQSRWKCSYVRLVVWTLKVRPGSPHEREWNQNWHNSPTSLDLPKALCHVRSGQVRSAAFTQPCLQLHMWSLFRSHGCCIEWSLAAALSGAWLLPWVELGYCLEWSLATALSGAWLPAFTKH